MCVTGVAGDRRRTERSAVFHSLVDLNSSIDSTQTTPPDDHAQFEAGQAEAFGALCAVFSSQPCGEPFLPVYLGRFYHCLRLGLTHQEVYTCMYTTIMPENFHFHNLAKFLASSLV